MQDLTLTPLTLTPSVLNARRQGFAVMLIAEATRPVSAEAGAEAVRRMAAAGAVIV